MLKNEFRYLVKMVALHGNNLQHLSIDGRIILQWMLKKQSVRVWPGFRIGVGVVMDCQVLQRRRTF
jgi:hypothetical protein